MDSRQKKREKDEVPHGSGYSWGNEAQIPQHYFIRDFIKVKSLGMRDAQSGGTTSRKPPQIS